MRKLIISATMILVVLVTAVGCGGGSAVSDSPVEALRKDIVGEWILGSYGSLTFAADGRYWMGEDPGVSYDCPTYRISDDMSLEFIGSGTEFSWGKDMVYVTYYWYIDGDKLIINENGYDRIFVKK